MAECTNCGGYATKKGWLCKNCYNKNKNSEEVQVLEKETKEIPNNGLPYQYDMIKGRIAESLIEELFLSLGYNVFHYGMEKTIPGIMKLLKGVNRNSEVATQIRCMPDFVVQNPKTDKVFFIEVKFRKNGAFLLKDLKKGYPYENAYIVLVSKRHIKCISIAELKAGKEITEKTQNYLGSRKEFELDKETIITFCKFAVQFFKSVE